MQYRRANAAGAAYFFTVNLADRSAQTLVQHINDLKKVMQKVKAAHPYALIAQAVMPEHLHAIWRLPPGDADFPMRWSLIKAGFSRHIAKTENVAESRAAKRERGIWQRRYWEHQIRDDTDLEQHVDYIHYNPVKHRWVKRSSDWPHSTLHEYIKRGMVTRDWGGSLTEGEKTYGER
jgi:putative transposase